MDDNIKLEKLLVLLQGCFDKYSESPECQRNIEVEFWLGEKPLKLKRIGQFGIEPDITIRLEEW